MIADNVQTANDVEIHRRAVYAEIQRQWQIYGELTDRLRAMGVKDPEQVS